MLLGIRVSPSRHRCVTGPIVLRGHRCPRHGCQSSTPAGVRVATASEKERCNHVMNFLIVVLSLTHPQTDLSIYFHA